MRHIRSNGFYVILKGKYSDAFKKPSRKFFFNKNRIEQNIYIFLWCPNCAKDIESRRAHFYQHTKVDNLYKNPTLLSTKYLLLWSWTNYLRIQKFRTFSLFFIPILCWQVRLSISFTWFYKEYFKSIPGLTQCARHLSLNLII